MLLLYFIVLGIVVMTIVCAASPYVYFLSLENYIRFQKGVQASSILLILYSLTAVSLLLLAYFFPTTKKDDNFYTYQPWWIESFSPFYFVEKGAKEEAEESFMKRVSNHRHAVRVIAATHHHYNMVQGVTTQRGSLKHIVSLMIIVVTTILIFIPAILRAIVMFEGRFNMYGSRLTDPVVMYIFWGLCEVIINALYIIGRVDLRFYRPDRLPKRVRNIITAEQSLHNTSDNQSLVSLDASILSGEKPVSHSGARYTTTDDDELSHSSDFVFDGHTMDTESPPYPSDEFKF
jgi:hypothetical protein